MNADQTDRPPGAFFGRRHGKTLRATPAAALGEILPRYRIDLSEPAPTPLASLFEAPVSAVRLEIGFGGGEHLLHEVDRFPETGFIGVEPFVNGMAKTVAVLERRPRGNVRLYDEDATHVLDWLPDATLDGVDLFYPDPWPKKRHWKRRFVSTANLDRFARVLKSGGVFRFASDIDHYVNWTLLAVTAHRSLEWTARRADDWRTPYEGWPGTRYEAKAIREGRTPAYLAFARR
ncbi:MAG: tRNA (guanosine(46)-N(7))-methyltransferase TrmB [Rhizobiaceae bacterium]